jgi:hypothetical protein
MRVRCPKKCTRKIGILVTGVFHEKSILGQGDFLKLKIKIEKYIIYI